VLVRSTPAGATVTVDGTEYGRTPTTIRDLAIGAHQVTVSRAGYTSSERRIVLTRTRPAQSMQFALERPSRAAAAPPSSSAAPSRPAGVSGELTIDSRPTGARVYLDGKLMGNTPLSLPTVDVGEHAVRLEREGYKGWSSQVRILAAEHNRVTASLER
jgi:PEGA domain